jgi:CheY-like chemotaxis protein
MATTIPTMDWTIEFSFPPSLDRLPLFINNELLIGRLDTDYPGTSAVLDLSAFRGAELGVSRKHALIRWQGSNLVLIDQNSDNGTILNDIRLQADIPYRLNDGDTIFFGHLKVQVKINRDLGTSAIKAQRVEIDLANAPLRMRGQRVLVVEDDVLLNKIYTKLLEDAGFSVQICRDVVGAIRALNGHTPSLILLDLMLPGVHGLELCRYVRRDTDYPSVPIVVVSALGDEETVQQVMQAGADFYLTKPINPRELVATLSALVHKHEAENPGLHTKRLAGTASLDFIHGAKRDDIVVFFVDGHREPVGTVVEKEVILGRGNPGASTRTYVDLGKHGAFDKGVSRLHAKIRRVERGFDVQDLDSANGTFINGRSIGKTEIVPLSNGDELRLGELRMHIYLLAEAGTIPTDAQAT